MTTMEPSLSMPLDPTVKEELGLTASASSSSRLNNLSSSSRRLRHISPPPVSRHATERKALGTNQSSLSHSSQSILSMFDFPSLPISIHEPHRASTRPASTRMHKVIKGIFLAWSWFCLAYFSVSVCGALRRVEIGWRDSRSVGADFNTPENILTTLPLEHRLSKLSSLYPIPASLEPFVLGPRRHEDNATVACLWAEDSGLSMVQIWASSWGGPVSLLVTSSAKPGSPSYNNMISEITYISHTTPNVSFHVLHTPSPLRNFNAYINLARLFSPSSQVLLFPPSSLALSAPLPQASAALLNATKTDNGGFIIPMQPTAISNGSNADISRSILLPSSALFLDRDSAPWCTERLFTITDQIIRRKEDGSLAADTEMAYHWQECVWNTWLRSRGKMRMLSNEGWAVSEAAHSLLRLDPLLETVETNLRTRLARKQRSETCILVARELIAMGHWFETAPTPSLDQVSTSPPGGNSEMESVQTAKAVEARDMNAKRHPMESSQAEWLRSVCPETLERWGKEIIME